MLDLSLKGSTTKMVHMILHHDAIDPTQWDLFVARHPSGHILQSAQWGTLKSQFGWRCRRVAVAQSDHLLLAGAQILFRRVAGLTIAYVPRGPVTDWTDATVTRRIMNEIIDICREEAATLLKLEPELIDMPTNHALLHSYGLTPSEETIQPPSTIILTIGDSEDAILKRMKSKWRYNIRLAARKGITVREAMPDDMAAFNTMMADTGNRDGFTVHSPAYYEKAYELFVPEQAAYLLAEYEGTPLAAIVVFVLGDTAWYLWGASSNRERNRMPNHALQWAGIRWAREHGATHYDLWGIPDEVGQMAVDANSWDGTPVPSSALAIDVNALPQGELWGVYRFKQGFGGDVVRHIGAWEMALKSQHHKLYRLGMRARALNTKVRQRGSAVRAASQAQQATATPPPGLRAVNDPSTWRATLEQLPNPHLLQSWEWGQLKEQTDWHAERYIVEQKRKPVAAFQFLWRQLSGSMPVRVAYVPKGPVVDWRDEKVVGATLEHIEQLAQRRGCIFVKIDPDVREDRTEGPRVLHTLHRREWCFSPEQIQFKNTAYTDLSGGEEAVLAAMKSKWRYNIRLAGRRGLSVRNCGMGELSTFYDLYAETGARDGFLIRPFDYYEPIWRSYLNAQQDEPNPAGGALLLAEHADDHLPVAGLFLMRYGDRSWYFYGASSERHRRDMPNYLLQFEAMRWAMEQGCTCYDWWGAPTDLEDEEDSMQGVWRFKQGFGAEFAPHIGAWDFPIKDTLYATYTRAIPAALGVMRRFR